MNKKIINNKLLFLKIEFKHKIYENISYNYIRQSSYKLYLDEKYYIILLYIHNFNNKKHKTIIYSHGKDETLGSIYSFLYDLSSNLKCNILTYDYSGYGLSNGIPTLEKFNDNIKKISLFANNILNINTSDIILMSNDYGCFPNLNLASNNDFKDIHCIILINPIFNINFSKSNIHSKNISEENSINNLEFYNNKEKVNKIFSPIFVIHGQNNEKISHSKKLIKYMNNYLKWFPLNVSNQNEILLNYRENFYIKISYFINNSYKFINITSKNILNSQNNSISILNSNNFLISKKLGVQREENEKIKKNNDIDNNDDNNSNFTIIKKTDTFNYDISDIE